VTAFIGRREFVTLLGGAAAARPLVAGAQQTIRRIGMLLPSAADDAEFQIRVGAFLEGLQQSGWTIGQNLQIDSRWATTNAVEIRRHAAELAALAPDAILTSSSPALAALQQATRTVPIVFVNVIDPVGSGFVDSLTRPNGNTTGFLLFEYSLSGKWLELLKQIAPNVTRAAVFRDTGNPSGNAQFGAIQALAPSLGIEVSPINMRDASEIEGAVAAFARSANGGLIVTGSALATVHRNLIIELAARAKLPDGARSTDVNAGTRRSARCRRNPSSSGLKRPQVKSGTSRNRPLCERLNRWRHPRRRSRWHVLSPSIPL
jgi:putative ABC transport system substrate-binding protein